MFFLFFKDLFYMNMCVVSFWKSVYRSLQNLKEGIRCFGAEVEEVSELPCGWWDPKLLSSARAESALRHLSISPAHIFCLFMQFVFSLDKDRLITYWFPTNAAVISWAATWTSSCTRTSPNLEHVPTNSILCSYVSVSLASMTRSHCYSQRGNLVYYITGF